MRRQFTMAALGGVIVVVVVAAILVGRGLSGTTKSDSPTPVPTVQPLPTAVHNGHHHPRFTSQFVSFVGQVCRAFQHGHAVAIENSLMNYQYNNSVYYSPFNLGPGTTALPTTLGSWVTTRRIRCIRYAEPYARHGVLMTKGWSQPGGWGVIDLDIAPGRGNWSLNDFTFGSRQQVMGAFFSNNVASARYRGKV